MQNLLFRKQSEIVLTNISVFSIFTLLALSISMIFPPISTSAEVSTATASGVAYAASISNDSIASIPITPTNTQTTYKTTNNISLSSTCSKGTTVYISSNSSSNTMSRSGADSSTKTIKPTTSITTLQDNSWGYSLDGENFSAVPVNSSPAILYSKSAAESKTISVDYGVKIDNSLPSGVYTADVIYTLTMSPMCDKYNLTFNTNGGTSISSIQPNYGDSVNLTNYTTSRTGYNFSKWVSTDSKEFAYNANTNVNTSNKADITLTANWTPVNYSITYNLNGGSATNPSSYNIETNTFTLNNPTRAGYTFTGWSGSGTGASVSVAKGSTGNKTYTANWTPASYSITYNLNGGSATNPTSYNIETNTFTLNNPTRAGYIFTGWTGSNGTTAQTSVSITKGSTGNKTYTANWKQEVDNSMFSITYMQDMTSTICTNTTTPLSTATSFTTTKSNDTSLIPQKTLIDKRDNKSYIVRKLADGNCWMTQNLAIAGGTTLTAETSDVTSNYTLPASSTTGFSENAKAYIYNGTHIDGTNDTKTTNTGGYYSYVAATAGTGSSVTTQFANATGSICPKGWKLPSGISSETYNSTNTGDMWQLYQAYDALTSSYTSSMNTNFKNAWSPGYVGVYNSSTLTNSGSYSYWWSSTVNSSINAYRMYLDTSGDLYPGTSSRYYRNGFSVRCVAQ